MVSTESERLTALDAAVQAFLNDRDARQDALVARKTLTFTCVEAHAVGISDQQLANAFANAAHNAAALSRARIQQIRSSG